MDGGKKSTRKKSSDKCRFASVTGDSKELLEKLLGFPSGIATNHCFYYELDENKGIKRWGVTLKQMPVDENNIVNSSAQHLLKCSWQYYPKEEILQVAQACIDDGWKTLTKEQTKEVKELFKKTLGNKVNFTDL